MRKPMNTSWSPLPRFEQQIRLCNYHTVQGSTCFHVAIMYTSDEEKRQHLIGWMDKFTHFTELVRQLLIQAHLGNTPTMEKREEIEASYSDFFKSMETDPQQKYLRQYTGEIECIYALYKNVVACNANL